MSKKMFGKVVAAGSVLGALAWVYRKYDTIKTMYNQVFFAKSDSVSYDTFEGEALAAMFSSVEMDLTKAEFVEKEVYMDLYGLCSVIKVYIPENIHVVCEGRERFSAVNSHDVIKEDMDEEEQVTLYLNYHAFASAIIVTTEKESCDCGHHHDHSHRDPSEVIIDEFEDPMDEDSYETVHVTTVDESEREMEASEQATAK